MTTYQDKEVCNEFIVASIVGVRKRCTQYWDRQPKSFNFQKVQFLCRVLVYRSILMYCSYLEIIE